MEKIPPPSKNAMFDERLTVAESKINEIVEFVNSITGQLSDTAIDEVVDIQDNNGD